mgnify:CR=1 FL=1
MIEKTYKDYVRRIKHFASKPELRRAWKDAAEKHSNQIIVDMINKGAREDSIELVKLMQDKQLEKELAGEPMPKALWEVINKKQK